MQILIAEDDSVSALVLRRTLEKLGHTVTVTDSGAAAWAAFQTVSFPVVITDWMMPETDGLDLCRMIRAQDGAKYTYVCMLTAKDSREDRLRALEAGADDFLVKPLDGEELASRLRVASRLLSLQEDLARHQDDLEQQNERLMETMGYVSAANRRFSELFEGLPVACYSVDEDGRIHEWNRAAAALLGFASHEAVSRTLWDLLFSPGDTDSAQEQKLLLRQALRGETLPEWEWQARTKDGDLRRLLSRALPVCGADGGGISGVICAHVDITERDALKRRLEAQGEALAVANARLEELVTMDALTGLKNRRFLNDALETAYSFAVRQSLPLSVIMLDVDHFKQYNDAFGHPEGDTVLRMVGQVLHDSTRDHDCTARYGGEEFAVLLPATDARGAVLVAERLRRTLEACTEARRTVTASIGVATLGPAIGSADILLQEADLALYRSKAAGRNRVTHALDPVALQAA